MATTDDRQQAARLIKIHKRNLERLEIQKANLAGTVNLAVDNQIDEEKANITALEPIANPPPTPSPKILEFVKQAAPGEIDLMMLFLQGTQLNTRMTKAEEQNADILASQSRASIDRMKTNEAIDGLVIQAHATDAARVSGQKRNRLSLFAIAVTLLVLAIGMLFIVVALRRHGF